MEFDMDKGTCSIDGCDRPVRTGDLCARHYDRMLKSRPPRRVEVWKPCKVDDCWRPVQTRGYCGAHYHRWQRGTEIDSTPIAAYGRSGCLIEGCTAPHMGRGYCQAHLYRLNANGDPLITRPPGRKPGEAPSGPESAAWKGGVAIYSTVHKRLSRAFGDAASHSCVGCGRQASDWSYNYGSSDEGVDDEGRVYATDLSFYSPRCRPCHRRYDADQQSVVEDWMAAES